MRRKIDKVTRWLQKHRLISVLLILLLAGLLVFIAVFLSRVALKQVILEVGDYSVTHEQYDKYLTAGNRYDISPTETRKIVIDYLKAKEVSKKLSLKVSSYGVDAARYNSLVEYIGDMQQAQEVIENQDFALGSMAAYTYAVRLQAYVNQTKGKNIVLYSFPAAGHISPNGLGVDPDNLRYAKQQAEEVHQEIVRKQGREKDNRNSPREAISSIKRNPRLQYVGASNDTGVYYMGAGGLQYDLTSLNRDTGEATKDFARQDVVDVINKLEPGKTSPVTVQKMVDERHGLVVESGYFFVEVLDESDGKEGLYGRYEQEMNAVRVVEYDK